MRRLALLALAAPAVAGCHDHRFDRYDFQVIAADPDVVLTSGSFQLALGESATITMQFHDRDDALLDGELVSASPGVVGLRPALDQQVVLLGVSPGATSLRILIDGADVGGISAVVAPLGPTGDAGVADGAERTADAGAD